MFRHSQTRLRSRDSFHLRHYFDAGDRFTHLHRLTGLFVQFGDDTADLCLDSYFIARFYLTGNDGLFLQIAFLNPQTLVLNGSRLLPLPKEEERSQDTYDQQADKNPFECFFHIVVFLFFVQCFYRFYFQGTESRHQTCQRAYQDDDHQTDDGDIE